MTDTVTITNGMPATVTELKTWLQKHERIVIIILILSALLLGGNKYINYQAEVAKTQATLAAQTLTQQQQANAQIAQQVQATTAQYQQMIATLTQQNTSLAASIGARNTALQTQKQVDSTLPVPDLAKRWQALANVPASDMVATGNAITVNIEGALATVQQLEQLPTLLANLKDTQQIASNRQAELGKADALITGLNTQVTGLNKQITDQDKSCKAEIASVKASARKSKRNWFITGVVTGAAVVAHFGLGI